MAKVVEQQSLGWLVNRERPRRRLHQAAVAGSQSSGQHVLVPTGSFRRCASPIGGSAAQHLPSCSGTSHCINPTAEGNLRLSAQPAVRADIRPAGGRGSTIR